MKTYLVGGAVRDQLLGLAVKERDYVVVGAHPQQLLDLGYKAVGKDFPVFLHPTTHEEYALARTERKTGQGYYGFSCYAAPDVTLEDDLKRRDLTINAMAMDDQGTLIDPYQGQADLQAKVLRHVSPAFSEDPVRILRLGRFLARYQHLGFRVAEETLELTREMVRAGEVKALVAERVWQEWHGALTEPSPGAFIELLRSCGALKILLPELDRLFGVPNRPEYHPEIDTGVHTLMVLQQATALSPDPLVRFAALVHDLGKGVTPEREWPSHKGHEEAGVPLVKAVCQRYKVPKAYQELATLTAKYHLYLHQAYILRDNTIVKFFEKLDAFRRPERFKLFLLACEADFRGRPGFELKEYNNGQYFLGMLEAANKITTQDLLDQNLSGEAIKQKIHQRRIEQINQFRKTSQTDS